MSVLQRSRSDILGGQLNQTADTKIMKTLEPTRHQRARLAVIFIALFALLSVNAKSTRVVAAGPPPLTLILVRHAEKQVVPPENKDPDLSPAGTARADELARMFGNAGIEAIYATQYKRTQQTVRPLSEKLGIGVTEIDAKKTPDLVAKIRTRNAGQVIFIAGHNNTVPEIIAAMGGPQLPIIPETEYDNLYILTVQSDGTTRLLKMKYGSALPASGQGMMKQ